MLQNGGIRPETEARYPRPIYHRFWLKHFTITICCFRRCSFQRLVNLGKHEINKLSSSRWYNFLIIAMFYFDLRYSSLVLLLFPKNLDH